LYKKEIEQRFKKSEMNSNFVFPRKKSVNMNEVSKVSKPKVTQHHKHKRNMTIGTVGMLFKTQDSRPSTTKSHYS